MYIVSGTARSGTSLMMSILVKAIGKHRLVGYQFPVEEFYLERLSNETDEMYKYRIYTHENDTNFLEDIKKSRQMNPIGFWEHPHFSVSGLNYQNVKIKIIDNIKNNSLTQIAKIESRGLPNTNPKYIDKVVYMVRDPHQVAKSQENLKRRNKFIIEGTNTDIFENLNTNSPQMYIDTNIASAKWLLKNKVPYLIVNYDDLIETPIDSINKIKHFINDGNFKDTHTLIKKKLKRSTNFQNESKIPIWDEAEKVYDFVRNNNLKKLVDYASTDLESIKNTKNWHCSRYGKQVFHKTCEMCISNIEFRKTLIAHSNKEWEKKPCAYECAYRDKNLISIEDSIKNNFWVE